MVFSAQGAGELVRFVGGDGKLSLHLRGENLEEEQVARAEDYFAAFGVDKESAEISLTGEGAQRVESFEAELGADVGQATQMALDVFYEVYRLADDFSLEIEEN